MFGKYLPPVRLAILALFAFSVIALVGESSSVEATSVVPSVGRTLRGVYFYNAIPNSVQTAAYGGAGMTVTDLATSNEFQVDFPSGTWTNSKTNKLCYFVPTVTLLNGSAGSGPASIGTLVENADGSGEFNIWTEGNGSLSITAQSADC